MPIFNAPLIKLDTNECKRYAGLASKTDFPDKLIDQACLEAQTLVKPRGVWEVYPYNNKSNTIMANRPISLCGKSIISHLKDAEKIAVMAVTIGSQLEIEVTRHFEKGDYTLGLLLDAAGTTAVEANADSVSALIQQAAARLGLTPLFRFSPGYGDWDITNQPDILALSGAAQIDIHITPTCMLQPRKSVTAVIGLVPHSVTNREAAPCKINSCQNCNQLTCLARKEYPQS
jgi:cobalamin-dependent methionine synthase I